MKALTLRCVRKVRAKGYLSSAYTKYGEDGIKFRIYDLVLYETALLRSNKSIWKKCRDLGHTIRVDLHRQEDRVDHDKLLDKGIKLAKRNGWLFLVGISHGSAMNVGFLELLAATGNNEEIE